MIGHYYSGIVTVLVEKYVYSRDGNRSYLKEIRGHWTGGDEIYNKPLNQFIGLLWNDSIGGCSDVIG
jgi:hypothetical protein